MRIVYCFAALLLAVAGGAPAQDYPRRPIRFVVPRCCGLPLPEEP